VHPGLDELGDPLQDRGLVGARGAAGQLHVLVDLSGEIGGHQALERVADLAQVGVGGRVGVDLDPCQQTGDLRGAAGHALGPRLAPSGEVGDPVADPPLPEVAEVVGGVGGNHQSATAHQGGGEHDVGGDGGHVHPVTSYLSTLFTFGYATHNT